MDVPSDDVLWVNLLFRGSKTTGEPVQPERDEYVTEFERNNLTAIHLPILEFSFRNLDVLTQTLQGLPNEPDSHINGLIIISPRVVDALEQAFAQLGDKQTDIIGRLNRDFIFAVGPKSAKECKRRLGLECNPESSGTGCSEKLIQLIKSMCDNRREKIHIIFPRGSLSDEATLIALKEFVTPIEVYETKANGSLESDIIEGLSKLNVQDCKTKLVVNHIFFSPSGVDGFRKVQSEAYKMRLQEWASNRSVELRYSAIGKTTAAALVRCNFEVFSVSEEPTPASLVKSLTNRMLHD